MSQQPSAMTSRERVTAALNCEERIRHYLRTRPVRHVRRLLLSNRPIMHPPLLGIVIIFGLARVLATASPLLERTNLFESWTGGYGLFRIPGVVVTAKGTVLAYCEARRSGSDWAEMDVLMRRGTDGGRSWEAARNICRVEGPKPKNPVRLNANTNEVTYNNPIAIADRDGTVHFLFCLEYMRCFYQRSGDDGVTWSTPVEITSAFEAFRPRFDWRTLATGPGHGIQLRSGRLLAPVWISLGRGGNNHSPSLNAVIYSDDHGKSWHAGEIALTDTTLTASASETALVQLADDRVMLGVRARANDQQRVFAVSQDGATQWSSPWTAREIGEPGCMAGLVRHSVAPASDRNRILFSLPAPQDATDGANLPAGSSERKNLTIRMSCDEGRTWPVRKTLEPGRAAYSDLAVLPDGTILCFYEAGNPKRKTDNPKPYDFLTMARFNLEWLTDGSDKGKQIADQILQTDANPAVPVADAKREFKIEKRYLNLPIKNGAPKRVVATLADGRVAVKNNIELADAQPDWWAPMDVSAWRGQTVTLQVDKLPGDSTALSQVEQSDSIKGAENLYREPLRGQFHFSPRRGWNNDPNGLVFYNGEYHMFFQHNPYGWSWGNMHWGHAVSRDMVRWKELPDALAPDDLGPMYSGSAVMDWRNTSGFGKPGQPAQVLIYTTAGNPTVQCLAYSSDGRSFTKFSGNPVLKQITHGNRDPKVLWHEPTKKWVMTLYVETNKVHSIHFLSSPNLKDWTLMSRKDGFFECPDFFELPVNGDATRKKWVLTAASSEYRVGTFDGTTFTPETPKLPGHRGKGFYAAQTFSDIPASDGRRIQVGWFQTATKGMPFNQSMSLPLELKLVPTADGPRLTWTPVKELNLLRAKSHDLGAATLKPGSANPLAGVKAELIELRAEFQPGDAGEVVFTVRGAQIVFDAKQQELVVNGHRAPAPLRDGRQHLTIFCDRMGLEVFASNGLTYVPMPFIPDATDLALGVQAKGGSAQFSLLEVHELKSAWEHP